MIPEIANLDALERVIANRAVLVDVREPAEYAESHLPGAINLPSTQFTPDAYLSFGAQPIYLICNSGSRAKQIAAELQKHGVTQVFLLAQQMDTLTEARQFGHFLVANSTGWSIDRQFRMTLGLLLLTFLLGYTLWSTLFMVIPVILSAGLIITAIIDRCYLRVGIAMLPWNRARREHVAAGGLDPTTTRGESAVPVALKKTAS